MNGIRAIEKSEPSMPMGDQFNEEELGIWDNSPGLGVGSMCLGMP